MDTRVIPFRLAGGGTLRIAAPVFRTATRTIRPVDALLLAPFAVPAVIVILLLLLAWFVLWLATVGLLTARIVTIDVVRIAGGGLARALDPRSISFQGR